MRSIALAALAGFAALVATAHANQPPPVRRSEVWHRAITAAQTDLEACKALAGTTFGDVVLELDDKHNTWTSSASKSLGAVGAKIALCAKKAIGKHLPLQYDFDDMFERGRPLSHEMTIGDPVAVLPPPRTLLPIWRRAIGTGRDAEVAKLELGKLLPPDYKLTRDTCLVTKRPAIRSAQNLWLPNVGTWIPRIWHAPLHELIGLESSSAVWSGPGELVVAHGDGVCLVPFDGTKQAALRRKMDAAGSCWSGGFEDVLLRPHVEFPRDQYTSIATLGGRTCATTATGTVTCCGATDPPLPAAPKVTSSLVLGHAFACGLDATSAIACWGTIGAPPTGTFTRLATDGQTMCGVRATGELACWGPPPPQPGFPIFAAPAPPAGHFLDVALRNGSGCAIRADATMTCWTAKRAREVPGKFASVVAADFMTCAVRADGTAGCWGDDTTVDTPSANRFATIALGASALCGRLADDTLACTRPPPHAEYTLAPTGKARQIVGGGMQVCVLRADHSIACWGDVFPSRWIGDNTFPYTKTMMFGYGPMQPATALRGQVVDEAGKPIAGAEVLICNDRGPCTWVAMLARTSSQHLAELVTKAHVDLPIATATTDRDGRWTTTFTAKPIYAGDQLEAVITAPGREIVERRASYVEPDKLAPDVMLRPAIAVDIDASCDAKPCGGTLRIAQSHYRWFDGTHLEHVAPGSYELDVRRDANTPAERRGKVRIDVAFGSKAQRLAVALHAVGTGKSIRGTATLSNARAMGATPVPAARVQAACGDADDPIIRDATSDANGAFELTDVGPPPCKLRIVNGSNDHDVTVDKLPATGVTLTGQMIQVPYHP